MKKLFFFLLLCTSITFFSCGSDDEDTTVADFLTATIDGNSYEASSIIGISDNSGSEELVLISGRNPSAGYAIGVNILESIEIGVENLIDENDLGILFSDAAENAFYTDGKFTLTARDTTNKVLEGTFSFTATQDGDPSNVIEVTNGELKVTYQ